jgi:hypothetical protein
VTLSIATLRADLEDAFAGVDGVTFISRRPGSIVPPCAWLATIDLTPESFGDGCHTYTLTIMFAVASTDEDTALAELEAFIDSNVLADALDPVGGIVRYIDVGGQIVDTAGTDFVGFAIELEVIR